MKKKYIEQDVYTATLQRIKLVFDNFENILVAFSCGKDSGVLLNMVYDYAKENNLLDRMGMYYMDYEADFEETEEVCGFFKVIELDCVSGNTIAHCWECE